MTIEGQKSYPGDQASPEKIAQLANEYRQAAAKLEQLGRKGVPLSLAPCRCVSIHAIELYLNAILVCAGHTAEQIRGLQHDLGARTDRALDAKFPLKKRTIDHLNDICRRREYLVARYDPEAPKTSEINQLNATLAELAKKVPVWINTRRQKT